MKKIFSFIFAAIIISSMSFAAFAGFTSMPKTEEDEIETVVVTAALDKSYTPLDKLEIFERYEVKNEEVEEVKGRIFTINFKIVNNTKNIVYAREIFEGFDIIVIESLTEKEINWWTKAKDAGFNMDLSKVAINPGESCTISFKIYAITEKAVNIFVVYEGQKLDVEKDATFVLIAETETVIETSSSTAEATTLVNEETTSKIETITEDISLEIDDDGSAEKTPAAPADNDDEIPNTGSSTWIGAFGFLFAAATAALVMERKKENN